LKICNSLNTNRIVFNIVRRRSEMTHQQRVSRSGSAVTERAVGERRQRLLLAFVLEEDILSTCCNTDDWCNVTHVTFWEIITVTRVRCYLDNHFWANACATGLVAWLSGNAFDSINEVTLLQAGLVLRWVTGCGQVNHLGM